MGINLRKLIFNQLRSCPVGHLGHRWISCDHVAPTGLSWLPAFTTNPVARRPGVFWTPHVAAFRITSLISIVFHPHHLPVPFSVSQGTTRRSTPQPSMLLGATPLLQA